MLSKNILVIGCWLFLVSLSLSNSHVSANKAGDTPTVTVNETREVIPNILDATFTESAYAHAQHLVWVEGRFKHIEGELYMTLLDTKGNILQREFTKVEMANQIDEKWSSFRHKLVEDTWTTVDIDEAVIVFEVRKNEKTVHRGKLKIPMERPR